MFDAAPRARATRVGGFVAFENKLYALKPLCEVRADVTLGCHGLSCTFCRIENPLVRGGLSRRRRRLLDKRSSRYQHFVMLLEWDVRVNSRSTIASRLYDCIFAYYLRNEREKRERTICSCLTRKRCYFRNYTIIEYRVTFARDRARSRFPSLRVTFVHRRLKRLLNSPQYAI